MELGGLGIEDRGEDSHLLSVGLCAVCHCCFNQGQTAAGHQSPGQLKLLCMQD